MEHFADKFIQFQPHRTMFAQLDPRRSALPPPTTTPPSPPPIHPPPIFPHPLLYITLNPCLSVN